ncbi:hypothetical protein EDB80DRAFT_683945 [Ilyonectria destructans]|nr:hypothetical protein EDB80DRAFT_683945 [Ilyonectria destructans]
MLPPLSHRWSRASKPVLVSWIFSRGHVSPSGKLPFTSTNPFPGYNISPSINNQVLAVAKNESDYPPNTISDEYSITPQANFTEKLLIDYRWFDSNNITPRFEFGFGLTYSTFEYRYIRINKASYPDKFAIQATNENSAGQMKGESIDDVLFSVSAKVKITGDWVASEVAQFVNIPPRYC